MAGGEDTERVPYTLKCSFFGTTRGKICKNDLWSRIAFDGGALLLLELSRAG
jgi:hypothetical protein